jgi:ABC-2 type transport system permease protein
VLLGAVVVLACSVLLAATFVALSNAMALLLRQQEALIGLSQFITLPLAFLSSVMMAPTLMPGWVASVARFNPVNWAAEGGREALRSSPEWTLVLRDGGLLAGLAVLASLASLLAFRRYQRSI